MALTVVVRSGDAESPPTITLDAPRIVIGRGEGCEVRLPDPSVSHRHATLRQRGTDYVIIDEGSTNGTFVGPVRLSPQAPRVLRSGDLIRVGRVWLQVQIEQAVPAPQPGIATQEVALALVASALCAEGQASAPKVLVQDGPDAGRELTLEQFEQPYRIGRSAKAALCLSDADASRYHVELCRRGSRIWVKDLDSKNGSLLGQQRLIAHQETPWPPELPLQVGQNRLVYDDPVSAALEELERLADERLREDETIDPPAGESARETHIAPNAEPGGASRQAPIAAVPRRRGPPPAAATRWTTADLLIALLALVVLALSIVGLYWLFRGM
jgi:pSer/pThr/pTyr-binding forkhead associated (FHA) protein